MTTMMSAWAIKSFGGPEVFEKIQVERPDAGPSEIVIEVKATSVNPVDYKIRRGDAAFLAGSFPAVLHPDAAGIVTAVGGDVSNFSVGDRVYSFANGLMGKFGALAEYIAVDHRLAAKMPSNTDYSEAAALPLVSVTSWFALIDYATLDGKSILVEGGTGGVGHIAVQLAKWQGASVYATCGTDNKVVLTERLGADRAYNYKDVSAEEIVQDATNGEGFDYVFNTPGSPAINHAVVAAKQEGTILDILGEFPTEPGFQLKWLNFKSFFAGRSLIGGGHEERHGQILSELGKLVESGQVKPLLDDSRFTFDEIGSAHEFAENGNPTGKVVIAR